MLPIIPPDAKVRNPKLTDKLGKIPGVYLPYADAWSGMGKWAAREGVTDEELQQWSAWPGAGLGLRTGRLIAFDIDLEAGEANEHLRSYFATETTAPKRYRGNSSRVLYLFRWTGEKLQRKQRFTCNAGAVEILAEGQQFVAEGVHPSGASYEWEGRVAFDSLPALDERGLEDIARIIVLALELESPDAVEQYGGGAYADRFPPQSTLKADRFTIAAALAKIPNDLDYDAWVTLSMAVKAAAGDEVYPAWFDWSLQWPGNTSDSLAEKWASFQPPFKLGAEYVFDTAKSHDASAAVEQAASEFEAVAADVLDDQIYGRPPPMLERLFKTYFYVSSLSRFMRYGDNKTLLTDDQLSKKHIECGDYKAPRASAAYRYLSSLGHRDFYDRVDYLPGCEPVIDTEVGERVRNRWSPSTAKIPPQGTVSDAMVRPWVAHTDWMFPVEAERDVMLDWAAYLLKYPANKVNWAPLLRGGQGTGKDTWLRPVVVGVGPQNTGEVGMKELESQFNGWADGVKLLIGSEIHTFTRTETNDKLKPIIAATATNKLTINRKNVDLYDIENVICMVAMSNHKVAVQVEETDRRWFIPQTPEVAREAEHYDALHAWLDGAHEVPGVTGPDGRAATYTGAELVVRWLLDAPEWRSPLFNPQGRAPETDTKRDMRDAAKPPLEAWIGDAIEGGVAPFGGALFTLGEVLRAVPAQVRGRRALTERQLGILMKDQFGCAPADPNPVRLSRPLWPGGPSRTRVWCLRDLEKYQIMDHDALRAALEIERSGAQDFGPVGDLKSLLD